MRKIFVLNAKITHEDFLNEKEFNIHAKIINANWEMMHKWIRMLWTNEWLCYVKMIYDMHTITHVRHVNSHTRRGELNGSENNGFEKLLNLKSEFKNILKDVIILSSGK